MSAPERLRAFQGPQSRVASKGKKRFGYLGGRSENSFKKAMWDFHLIAGDIAGAQLPDWAKTEGSCDIPAPPGTRVAAFMREAAKCFVVSDAHGVFKSMVVHELGFFCKKRNRPERGQARDLVAVGIEEDRGGIAAADVAAPPGECGGRQPPEKRRKVGSARRPPALLERSDFERLVLAVLVTREWRDGVSRLSEAPDFLKTCCLRSGVPLRSMFPGLRCCSENDAAGTEWLEGCVCVERYQAASLVRECEADCLSDRGTARGTPPDRPGRAPARDDREGLQGEAPGADQDEEARDRDAEDDDEDESDKYSAQSQGDWYSAGSGLACLREGTSVSIGGAGCRSSVHPYTLTAACLASIASCRCGGRHPLAPTLREVKSLVERGGVSDAVLLGVLRGEAPAGTPCAEVCAAEAVLHAASRSTGGRPPVFPLFAPRSRVREAGVFFVDAARAVASALSPRAKVEEYVRLRRATRADPRAAYAECGLPVPDHLAPRETGAGTGTGTGGGEGADAVALSFPRQEVSPLDLATSLACVEAKMAARGLREGSDVIFSGEETFWIAPRWWADFVSECAVPHFMAYPACRPPHALQMYPALLKGYMTGDPVPVAHSLNTLLRMYHVSTLNGKKGRRVPLDRPESCAERYSYLAPICERVPTQNTMFLLVQEAYRIKMCERGDVLVNQKGELLGRREPTFESDLLRALKAFIEVDAPHYVQESALRALEAFVESGESGRNPDAASYCGENPLLPALVRSVRAAAADRDSRARVRPRGGRRVRIPDPSAGSSGRPEDALYRLCADRRYPDEDALRLFLAITSSGCMMFAKRLNRQHRGLSTVEQLEALWQKWPAYADAARTGPTAPSFSAPGGKAAQRCDRPAEGLRLLMMYIEELCFYEVRLPRSGLYLKSRDEYDNMVEDPGVSPGAAYRGCVERAGVFLSVPAKKIASFLDKSLPAAWPPESDEPLRCSDFFPVWRSEVGESASSRTRASLDTKNPFSGAAEGFLECLLLYPITNVSHDYVKTLFGTNKEGCG